MIGVGAVLFLVLLNGFFVATEFAIVAVRKSRLEQLVAEGRRGAATAKDVVGHLDLYIAACQFGITIASLALGWVGEPALADLLEPAIENVAGSLAHETAHAIAVAVTFLLITSLHIVLGELAPKGLALQRTERTALVVARPMKLFYFVFRWPIRLLNSTGNGVLRLMALRPASEAEMAHSIEELRYLLVGMQEVGEVEESEARIASRAFNFADHDAASLMTPRPDVVAVSADASPVEIVNQFVESGHSRLPVCRGSLDDVVGVVHVHDVLRAMSDEQFNLENLTRPISVIPETIGADQVLERLRADRRQLAVVVDEHGGTSGIVTLEDLFEALVGRIEEDVRLDGTGTVSESAVRLQEDGSYLVDGRVHLEELEEIGLTFDDALRSHVDTIGGVVMTGLGRLPQPGDQIEVDGFRLHVEVVDGRRAAEIRIVPLFESTDESQGNEAT